MRIHYAICCAVSFALLTLVACDRTPDGDAATTPASATPASTAPVPASKEVTMRYTCDRGVDVSVLRSGRVHARMPDGTVARLSLIADSSPPVFTGAGLYFRVGETRAFLSQGDGAEEVACLPQ